MKIEYSDDSLPKGTELFVDGLGKLVNGKEVEFDEEAVAAFEAQTGKKITDAFAENVNVHLSGSGSKSTAKTEDSNKKKEGGE